MGLRRGSHHPHRYPRARLDHRRRRRGNTAVWRQGNPAVGASYQARVTRDGGHTTLYGAPTFLDRHLDPDQQAALEAADTTARARLAAARAERRAARDNQLDALLDPLRSIARGLRTRDDKTAFLAHVLRELSRP